MQTRLIPSFLKTTSKAGEAPGALKHIGKKKIEVPHITMWVYNKEVCEERTVDNVNDCKTFILNDHVNWINLDGIHNTQIVESLGQQFGLHPLLLEDILNTSHRPKIEEFEDCFFVVVKMLHYSEKDKRVSVEQVSIVLKDNLVLTFQEQPQDIFDPMRERLRAGKGKLRSSGSDYLVYRILDAITDGYFTILEHIGNDIEEMEEQFIANPNDTFISSVYQMKREMLFVRRAIYPLRDVVVQLQHSESQFISDTTVPFLRDVYDHAIQATDSVDTFRDLLSNMLDNYLSLISNKMNSVMKVLTIIATIFIPLTFIAGVYGMNFKNMPELEWTLGYPAVWCVMITVFIVMVTYFRRKGWF
ncbi:magnesium/cobalt transporter CorA [Patescibacteria group bacterium]|nr:magnesium/cobalt transporter CorA [Patescibacteria group bacterium]MBU1123923.1 magnesium/cobalt transporter CorA [Patescibacteria group bacterium]